MLCQTSVIVRALSPLPLDYAFRHLRLRIDNSNGDLRLGTCSFSSDDCMLHMVCLYLLRTAAVARTLSTFSPFFVAFPESNTSISVVYPSSRRMEMELTVQDAVTSFLQVEVDRMADDELGWGLAMENALLSGLAAALVCDGWIVLEGNLAVYGSSMDWIDGSPAEAIAFAVRAEVNDCIDFLLSPDVIRFRCFKIERFLLGPLKRLFDGWAEVVLDNYLENMSPDDVQELKCLTLPSLKEGVVSGFCKSEPKDYNLDKYKEIWTTKHGLTLSKEDFYLQVSFPYEENMQKFWFPSCLVLRNCGLIPALPNIRAAKVQSILQKATSSISRWDFFNSGKLKLKSIFQKESQNFCWTTANMTLQSSQFKPNDSEFDLNSISKVSNFDVKVLQNLRRPKLSPSHYGGSENIEPDFSDTHGVDDLQTFGRSTFSINPSVSSKLGVPVFLKRKIRDVQIPGALKAEGEVQSGKENFKATTFLQKTRSRLRGTNSKSIAADTAIILSKQKRVCAEQEKSTFKKLQIRKIESITSEALKGSSLLKKNKDNCSLKVATTTGEKSARWQKKTIDSETNQKNILSKQAAGKVRELTVPDFNVFLSENKANIIGKKEELVERDHCALKVATATGEKLARGQKKTIDSETNQKKVLSKHAAGKLSELTVPELKVFLSENKAKVSGKKEELVERVIQLLSSLKHP